MNSFLGKRLFVDLTNETIETKEIPNDWAEQYTGQKGLGTRILMEDFDPKTDPLASDNKLVLTSSIMAGTIVSCSAKMAITTKSPQTGTITDGSIGGHAGAELKFAGYDAIEIVGKSDDLCYLYLDPDHAEIRRAPELKGLGTFETEKQIKLLCDDKQVKVLANGPAGENLVPYSCISTERYRQLGRGGIGAVFGSKNLKAIAIRGWLDVHVPDMEKCMAVAAELHKKDEISSPENMIYTDGTPVLVDFCQESGLLPTENFKKGRFEGYKNINSPALSKVRKNKKACFSCAIACGNYLKSGQSEVEGPEYETIALCGSNIGNDNREKLLEFNAICDDLGLDTISAGGSIAFMMEMTEKGIHNFDIRFGETDKALALLNDIAFKQGTGFDASMGSKALSEKYGGEEFAMQVKGMELPGYDPRGSWGMGVSYANAPRGGCHMTAYTIESEVWGDHDPFTFEQKGKLVVDLQNAQFAKFSMGVCDFWPIASDTLAKLYEVTYGGKWTAEQVDEIGERVINLQRMFNVMNGFSRKEDKLPDRLHKEMLMEGPPKNKSMTRDGFDSAMDDYYHARGWDSHGRPTLETIARLGIEGQFVEAYLACLAQ